MNVSTATPVLSMLPEKVDRVDPANRIVGVVVADGRLRNPVPVIVIVLPTAPVVGFMVMDAAVEGTM